ncbi:MAG: arginine--tRNA ligase [Deltaproteobacteria bacterium]|jgi:arginyl-tRNA synthetase|nr:arginine--tRNA ligase [Deltaproteobacteria bacterium]
MKQRIKNLILNAVSLAHENKALPSAEVFDIEVEVPKIASHGDFSTNIAMVTASIQKMSPRKIAEAILKHIKDPDRILEKTEIAGPGFINFFIKPLSWHPVLRKIHQEDMVYGVSNIGSGQKIQVEFVSSNPTGPLHVGHGRGAAVGDSVANILRFCGYDVQKEYYINDSGRQINTLGKSVYLRYRELMGENIQFPDECYQGDYIREYAKKIIELKGKALLDQNEEPSIFFCARFTAERIVEDIRKDLVDFGIEFDNWFSEQSLYDTGKVNGVIEDFKEKNIIYEKDGALWFKTTNYGDEKDRVVVRKNGQTTYFASDIAYHMDKFERGFHRVIDVWGADHHGYIPRVTAAIEASGLNRDQFQVILVQLVNLLREKEPVAMSTRAGEFVTLNEVITEVGRDAARFIFLTRHYESPLDFDLELAKKKTNDNPVFYVQYVHARISSILRKSRERGLDGLEWDEAVAMMLQEPEEINLMKVMNRYPEVVEDTAKYLEPHRITFYLMDLASSFHAYYNKHRVLSDDPILSKGRLYLVLAVQKVIRNGLTLLGVSAPDKM